MNARMMLPVVAFLAGCASNALYTGSGNADSLFDDIVDCARSGPTPTFRGKCRREFEDSIFTVRVSSIKTLGVSYITLFAEMGDPNQMINCSLKSSKSRERIEKVSSGETVKLKATPNVTFGEVTFIHFEDCSVE